VRIGDVQNHLQQWNGNGHPPGPGPWKSLFLTLLTLISACEECPPTVKRVERGPAMGPGPALLTQQWNGWGKQVSLLPNSETGGREGCAHSAQRVSHTQGGIPRVGTVSHTQRGIPRVYNSLSHLRYTRGVQPSLTPEVHPGGICTPLNPEVYPGGICTPLLNPEVYPGSVHLSTPWGIPG